MSPETLQSYIFELKYLLEQIFGKEVTDKNLDVNQIDDILRKTHFHEDFEMVLYSYGLLLFFPTSKHKDEILKERTSILQAAEPFIFFLQLKKIETNLKKPSADIQELMSTLTTIKPVVDRPKTPQIIKDIFKSISERVKTN